MKRLTFAIVKLCRVFLLFWVGFFIMKSSDMSYCESEDMIPLPEPGYTSNVSVERAIRERRSIRTFTDESLSIQEISQLLWSAQGITNKRGYRTAPSGGALYPLDVYAVVGNVSELQSGVYQYDPQRHALELKQSGDIRSALSAAALNQSCVKRGAVIIVFSAVYERITQKYGERGIRYTLIEVGHAAQNVYLQAVSLNLGTVAVGAFRDDEVKKIMKMERNENPLYLMPVGKKQNP